MKKYILCFLVCSVIIACVTTRKNYFVETEEIDQSILRVNPKDSAEFELIFVNNSDSEIAMGSYYRSFAMEFMVYNDKGEQINIINGTGSEYNMIEPGGKVIVSEHIVTIIQMALKDAKLDEKTFGKYTFVWKPPHFRLKPELSDFELSLEVIYDQGDIDYLRDFRNREFEEYIKNKNK